MSSAEKEEQHSNRAKQEILIVRARIEQHSQILLLELCFLLPQEIWRGGPPE